MTGKSYLLSLLSLLPLAAGGQQAVVNRQRAFPRTVPAGNYSGIAWMGGSRYAVANDKSPTAGFHLMTIDIDSLTGDIVNVVADTFLTSGQPNRDEEGICHVPQRGTVFVSGEADGQVLEYTLDGRLTGRRLDIPEVFQTAHKNGGLETLTYNAVTRRFWITSENTLTADGPKPTVRNKVPNRLRLQSFGLDLRPLEQYWYETDVSATHKTTGKSQLGVSGLAALDDGRLIVLEREVYQQKHLVGSFVEARLYCVWPSRQQAGEMLHKELVAQFRTKINLTVRSFANYEGLCAGPRLGDGRQVLLLVADSQDQHRGYLKDWFLTVVINAADNTPANP